MQEVISQTNPFFMALNIKSICSGDMAQLVAQRILTP
jgi:hypothetical protein